MHPHPPFLAYTINDIRPIREAHSLELERFAE